MENIELIDFTDYIIASSERDIISDFIRMKLMRIKKKQQLSNVFVVKIEADNNFVEFIKDYWESFSFKAKPNELSDFKIGCFMSKDYPEFEINNGLPIGTMKLIYNNGEECLITVKGERFEC